MEATSSATKPPLTYRFYWRRIRRAMQLGHHQKARTMAEAYVRRYPKSPNAWEALYRVLSQQGAWADAETAIRRGLDYLPSALRLLFRLSEALIAQHRFEGARHVLDQLHRQAPDSPLSFLGYGTLALYDEAWNEARRNADEALSRAREDNPWTLYEVAVRLIEVPGERDRAIGLLREASDKLPKEPLPHMLLGILLEDVDKQASTDQLAAARRVYGLKKEEFEGDVESMRARLNL